jgi:uridine kinase
MPTHLIATPQRVVVLSNIASYIQQLPGPRVKRVGIDGVDGAGKTVFADELRSILLDRGCHVIRASVDGFHNPREVRYRLGRYSPDGFYLASYNYEALITALLKPLSPGGSRIYRLAVFDHFLDRPTEMPELEAPLDAVLLFDGIFLHRPELRLYWDLSVFLEVPFEISLPRGAARGEAWGDSDPASPSSRRYVDGQRRYLKECHPHDLASIVVDNSSLSIPRVVRTLR